jgi:hypothetical protein
MSGTTLGNLQNLELQKAPNLSAKRKLLEMEAAPSKDPEMELINQYLACKATSEEEDKPLLFWKKHESQYPAMAALAKIYLCISCSSVAVESMFSITGLILNSRRSSLAPWRLNYLSFIHNNLPVFKGSLQ